MVLNVNIYPMEWRTLHFSITLGVPSIALFEKKKILFFLGLINNATGGGGGAMEKATFGMANVGTDSVLNLLWYFQHLSNPPPSMGQRQWEGEG